MTQEIKHYWIQWAKAAGVRAIRTFAQTMVALIGTTLVISEVDWVLVGSASLLAAFLSLLTSISGLPEVQMPDSMKSEVSADDINV